MKIQEEGWEKACKPIAVYFFCEKGSEKARMPSCIFCLQKFRKKAGKKLVCLVGYFFGESS